MVEATSEDGLFLDDIPTNITSNTRTLVSWRDCLFKSREGDSIGSKILGGGEISGYAIVPWDEYKALLAEVERMRAIWECIDCFMERYSDAEAGPCASHQPEPMPS